LIEKAKREIVRSSGDFKHSTLELVHRGAGQLIFKTDVKTDSGAQCVVLRFIAPSKLPEMRSKEACAASEIYAASLYAQGDFYSVRCLSQPAFQTWGVMINKYLPFKWADMIALESTCALVLQAQFYLLLQSLSHLHRIDLAYGGLSFHKSCARFTKEELSHLDPKFLPRRLHDKLGGEEAVPFSIESGKALDMYAFGACLYLAFYKQSKSRSSANALPEVSALNFVQREIPFIAQLNRKALSRLVTKLLGPEKARPTAAQVMKDPFFEALSSRPGARVSHIY
jgi:hypothetical protein